LPPGPELERLWIRAGLETVAGQRLADPPLGAARRLTDPSRAWSELAPWPAEAWWARIGRLTDSQRLAIARADAAWLDQLDEAWANAPPEIDELRRVRARGEIALARGRPPWTGEEEELLMAESLLVPGAPGDRAWSRLAAGDRPAAGAALGELEELMARTASDWEAAPEDGVRAVRSYPGWVLGVEARALRTLLRSS
jgi:hypothetical protein